MSDLRELYQEAILDHYKHPRNCRKLPTANRTAEGYNPLCGDKVTVYLVVDEGGIIKDISFEGSGCAISMASASLMTEHLKGKTLQQASAIFTKFHDTITGKVETAPEPDLGKLVVLAGVCEYPVRVKCASLVWHTMQAALKNQDKVVSTE